MNNLPKINSYINCCGRSINIYTIGMYLWIILWAVIFAVTKCLFSWNWIYLIYSIPIILGLYVLKNNYDVWKDKIRIEDYPVEVNLIEFVERNANYVILGVTALFIASELIFGNKKVDLTGFFTFQILALIFSIGFVLPLLWKPRIEGHASDLVLLRHWKTVWYTYSIYFFLSAALALVFTPMGVK